MAKAKEDSTEKREIVEDGLLEEKRLFRVDEAARFFSVSERTVRLWIDHGHLVAEKVVGSVRVTRDSILKCRRRFPAQ